jgi:hypothetical protein
MRRTRTYLTPPRHLRVPSRRNLLTAILRLQVMSTSVDEAAQLFEEGVQYIRGSPPPDSYIFFCCEVGLSTPMFLWRAGNKLDAAVDALGKALQLRCAATVLCSLRTSVEVAPSGTRLCLSGDVRLPPCSSYAVARGESTQ